MTMNPLPTGDGPLAGIRIFDLTRILAGPTLTQLLGDLGADVIKIERAGAGDDTRKWGPPFLKDPSGEDTTESAYFLCANRNKRSLTLDIAKPEGQALAKRLLRHCDVMVENFKVGGLDKYGLSYASLKDEFPSLVYCSITGFGQTGPYAPRAGYDFLAQGVGGIMSITGEPDGQPMKVGVGIADVMCGMYGAVAILAALRHRDETASGDFKGVGQHIDMSLIDTQIAWLINEGLNYLVGGKVPTRLGNEHPNIVPYKAMPTSDGWIILAVGNDAQYQRFCKFAGRPELAEDPRFVTNADRVRNRVAIYEILDEVTKLKSQSEWVDGLAELGVPCSPVNDLKQVFDDPQVIHRGARVEMPHPLAGGSGTAPMLANPIRMSETPPVYNRAPPTCGQHTDEVLHSLLELSDDEIADLRAKDVI